MTATATALAAPRALTPPERAKLRALLKANLKIVSDDDADDAEELLDYALEMVQGGKAAGHVAEELLFMEMPVCGEAEAAKVGETLAAFFASLESDSKDKDDAELQEWLVRLREKKSERLATVQKGRQAAGVRDRIAGLEEGKAKKGGGVSGVPKEGEQHPIAGLEKGKGKDDKGVLVGKKKEEERDALPPALSMTVAELKEELRARNDSGYVPHSRLALEAALAAARRKDGTDEAPQAAVKESGRGREEEKTEEGDVEEALPTAAGIQQSSIAIKQGNEKVGAKTARLDTGRQVKAWVTKPSQDCRLGIGLTGNGGTVRITSIAQDGLFARTNLKVGQVLGTINGEPCETATEAVARLYAAKGIAIVAYEEVGDIEEGATTASAGRSIFDGGSAAGGSADRGDEVLADVPQDRSHSHPATNRDTKDDEGKGMGLAILVLLVISFALAFVPNSSIAPYIAGVCLILALILTSSLTCHCCCAAGIELEDRAKKFITAALLAIVTMFVLGVVGAFVLSSNGMAITSGVTALGVISVVLNVAAMIFMALFVWGHDCGDGGCWSDRRSKRRTIILVGTAFALLMVAIPLGVVFGTTKQLCFADREELNSAVSKYIVGGDACREGSSECEVLQKYGWPIGSWCTSNVTDMSSLFQYRNKFDDDISSWDTSSVTSMVRMFRNAYSFNGDLSGWDTSQVTSMYEMFRAASSFNGDVSNWDTSNVTSMSGMFMRAQAFNGDVSSWDVSSVTDMVWMFNAAGSFNQNLCAWGVHYNDTAVDYGSMFYRSRCPGADEPDGPDTNWCKATCQEVASATSPPTPSPTTGPSAAPRLVMTITGVAALENADAWRNITEEHVSDYYVVNDDAGVWNTEVDIEIVNVADVSTEGDNIWTFPEQAVEVVYTQTSYYKTADPELLDDVYVASQPFQTVQGVEAYIAALQELSRYYDGVSDVNLAFSPPTVLPR